MKSILSDHIISILFVMLVFAILLVVSQETDSTDKKNSTDLVRQFAILQDIDFGNPVEREMFKETLNLFYPKDLSENDSIIRAIDSFRSEQFAKKMYKYGGTKKKLTWSTLLDLVGMYLKFIIIYIVVICLSYYSAQTLAIYQFIRQKQQALSYLRRIIHTTRSALINKQSIKERANKIVKVLILISLALSTGLFYLILFSPAYIIAYSLKSTIETGGYILMIVLGVVSNGILINYAYKFYTFLLHESQKGYVQTAIVKGLNKSYSWNTKDGISIKAMLTLKKSFPSHVFQHIYSNARYQFIPTMKQYASFLITGLIIIEMALNIQGHLCYELLQNILYRQYNIVIIIVFGIFLIVKTTEILVDYWFFSESQKYENN